MTTVGSQTDATLALITRFENGFNARDIDALMADMTEDTVFEHVAPEAVSFGRHEGQAAVRAAWQSFFAANPQPRFEVEKGVLSGDRAVYRWRYAWDGGHVRGVDFFVVRGGKVVEKLSYVKG